MQLVSTIPHRFRPIQIRPQWAVGTPPHNLKPFTHGHVDLNEFIHGHMRLKPWTVCASVPFKLLHARQRATQALARTATCNSSSCTHGNVQLKLLHARQRATQALPCTATCNSSPYTHGNVQLKLLCARLRATQALMRTATRNSSSY